MAHLVCTDHKKRVMVLSDGTAVHRENSKRCFTNTVKIGGKKHTTNDVLYFHVSSTTNKAIAHLRHGVLPAASKATAFSREKMSEAVKPFVEGLKHVGEAFKKVSDVLQVAGIIEHQDRLTQQLIDNTFSKPYGMPRRRTTTDRERELMNAVFGKLENVAHDTTIGTAHITSTSEGIGGITADIVLLDEFALSEKTRLLEEHEGFEMSSDPKFGDAEFNQFKYVDHHPDIEPPATSSGIWDQ